ncbi:MAG: hypothetical protein ACO3XJ_00415 [Candidatus Nanopelagicales bacterium]
MSNRTTTLLITALSSLLGYFVKIQCVLPFSLSIFSDVVRTCYSDISTLYGARDFYLGIIPYFQIQTDGQYLEYPVLIGLQMLITSVLTNNLFPGSWQFFSIVNWAINLVYTLVAVWYLHKISPRAARWFSLSPALLLVLGINWDAMAIMLMIFGIYFYQQKRYSHMGIALGLGMSAKLFPILLLPIAVIYFYESKNFRAIFQSILSAFTSWLAVNLIFIVFAFDGWIRFFEFSRERGIDFGSPYLALQFLSDVQVSASEANTIGLVGVTATYFAIYIFRKRLDFIVAVTLVITVFVLINKVYSPQFWLWLAPLLALIVTDRRNWIQWNIAEALYFFSVWAYIASYASNAYTLSAGTYAIFICIHFFSTIIAVLIAVRSSMRNQPQLVRDQNLL